MQAGATTKAVVAGVLVTALGGCRLPASESESGRDYGGGVPSSLTSVSITGETAAVMAGALAGVVLVGEAVSPSGTTGIGVELQAYPAGLIPGLHLQFPIGIEDGQFVTVRAAANITDRGDFGEQDDEEGGGFGGGVGWRSYLEPGRQGWLIGARVDLWSMEIDWTDDPGLVTEVKGTTDLLVLQPTIEAGYGWDLGGWRIELMAGLGVEVNLDEDGRDVGEGAIGLIGVTFVSNP